MKSIEEKIWDYVDGNLSDIETEELKLLIENNLEVKELYLQILDFQSDLKKIELEEPSMSFTRNIIEEINTLNPPKKLETQVNKGFIFAIIAFFIIFTTSLYVFWSKNNSLDIDFGIFKTNNIINTNYIYYILAFDIVLGLVFLDYFLRDSVRKKEKNI